MIGGVVGGVFLVGNNNKVIKVILKVLFIVFKGSIYIKVLYMELMVLLFEIFIKFCKEGLMLIEGDIEELESSFIFSKYFGVLVDYYLIEFMIDYLCLMVLGNMDVF